MRSRRAVPAGHAAKACRTSRETSAGAVGSGTNGGGLLVSLWTSERVASVTPTTMPTTATAAAPTTNHTRSRGLIHGDRIRVSAAIFRKAMPTYRELLQQVRAEISEIDAERARDLIEIGEPVIVDVREQDEWDEGHIPGALHIPRGHLESRIERAAPDTSQQVLLYCSAGNRSAFAAKTLEEMGYEDAVSLSGGFTDWKRNGFPVELQAGLDAPRRARYSRHLLIPEVGEQGQLKLLDSKVLLIGAGGLGSPASLYLAAAGVGRLGIVDADVVDESNLQRQIVHSTERLGEAKVDSAKRTIEALNPDVQVVAYKERLTSDNVERILADGWDVIVDGADNFPTRYLVNDASEIGRAHV